MAYFAIIKIGAVVMPLFSGFGPQAKNLIKNVFLVKGFERILHENLFQKLVENSLQILH